MALAYEQELGIKATGVSVTVPSDDIAKLMYYCDCIITCIPSLSANAQGERLLDYARYFDLSSTEKDAVVALSILLAPDKLLNQVIFAVAEGNPALGGKANEFFEISKRETLAGIIPDSSFSNVLVFEGNSVEVLKFMIITSGWLERNYLNPLKSQIYRLSSDSPSPPQKTITYTSTPTYSSPSYYSSSSSSRSSSSWGPCIILVCISLILSGIAYLIWTFFVDSSSVLYLVSRIIGGVLIGLGVLGIIAVFSRRQVIAFFFCAFFALTVLAIAGVYIYGILYVDKVVDVNIVCASPDITYTCDDLVQQAKQLIRTIIIVLLAVNLTCCGCCTFFACAHWSSLK